VLTCCGAAVSEAKACSLQRIAVKLKRLMAKGPPESIAEGQLNGAASKVLI